MSSAPSWPPHLEGACYEEAHGWYRPWREPGGEMRREPIPAETIREAGLPKHPELGDDTDVLVLCFRPLQNLIPRS